MPTEPSCADNGLCLDDVLLTEALSHRPARERDDRAENRALAALAREMTERPDNVLHKLAELVLELCRVDSAGVSILEPGQDGGVFRWHAATGYFAQQRNGHLPCGDSPCGVVVERGRVLLFDRPGRVFPALAAVEPPIQEGLLAPWTIDGKPAGTVWAVSHDPARHFDAEDARLLGVLSSFAAAAWQMVSALDDARRYEQTLERHVAERTRLLTQGIESLQAEMEQRRRTEAALHATEARLEADLDAMRRLYGLHAKLATETGLQEALDLILRTACEFTHTDRGCIQLASPDGRLDIVATRGYGPDSPFIEHFRHAGFVQDRATIEVERRRLLIRDVRTFRGLAGTADGAAFLADGILGAQSTPMVSRQGETVGMLSTQFDRPHRPGEEELRMIDLLAWTAADFIERHRAQEQLRRSEQRQAYLVTLNDVLRPLSDAVRIQSEAARVLGEHLHASRVGYGTDGDGLHLAVSRNYTDGVAEMEGQYRYNDFSKHLLPAFRTGRTVVRPDIAREPLDAAEQAAHAALSIAASVNVPLVKDGHLVAMLFVHQDRARAWSEAEIGLMQETAERTWAAIERARAEEALKDADRRKDEFLATLAHELRNPLAPISNAVHLMRRPDGRRVTDRLMGIVERQVRQIVKLVDDLLEISRITRGKIELDRQPVQLADAVRDAVETSRPLVEQARHQLDVSLPEEPLTLLADGTRLTQILANLVNNAAKYTEAGGHIWLSAAREGDGVAIRVRDDGLGIPDDELPRVFEMFAQAHQAGAPGSAAGSDGLGIGLAIVRKLVELHGGSVEAHSAGAHQGSEFVVRLPLLHGGAAYHERPAIAPQGTLDGQRILVVDDNRDAADTLAMLLASHGASVHVAYDGHAALALLPQLRPDTVLLDLGMPEMDGFAVARSIRADARVKDVRIVALTGWGQEADRQRTRAAGFDYHLTKPVDFDALEDWLRGSSVLE